MLRNTMGMTAEITLQIIIKEDFDPERIRKSVMRATHIWVPNSKRRKEHGVQTLWEVPEVYCIQNQWRGRSKACVGGEGPRRGIKQEGGGWWVRALSLEDCDVALPSPPSKKQLLPRMQGVLSAESLQQSVHVGIVSAAESTSPKATPLWSDLRLMTDRAGRKKASIFVSFPENTTSNSGCHVQESRYLDGILELDDLLPIWLDNEDSITSKHR